MSKKANPTAIGVFVLGAIALVVAGLAALGSGQLLRSHPRAVAFFKGSIQGLTKGATVNLRGVPVGSVSEIDLQLNLKDMQPIIPVYMEFDPDRFKVSGEKLTAVQLVKQDLLKGAIERGLHARLETQSLVTGQLVIELDLDPNVPRTFVGADPSTVEIPTSESDLTKLKNVVADLPLNRIAESTLQVLDDTHRLLTSGEVSQLLHSLASSSDQINQLVTDARKDFPPLVADISATMKTGRETIESAGKAMADLQATLKTTDQLLNTEGRQAVHVAIDALQKAQTALVNANGLMANANGILAVNSSERYEIDQTLRNLTATTRSLRVFADDLERRPNAIITGR